MIINHASNNLVRVKLRKGSKLDRLFGNEKDLILIGGALTTLERFKRFECSLAHAYPGGVVVCFGHSVGTHDDIQELYDIPTTEGRKDGNLPRQEHSS